MDVKCDFNHETLLNIGMGISGRNLEFNEEAKMHSYIWPTGFRFMREMRESSSMGASSFQKLHLMMSFLLPNLAKIGLDFIRLEQRQHLSRIKAGEPLLGCEAGEPLLGGARLASRSSGEGTLPLSFQSPPSPRVSVPSSSSHQSHHPCPLLPCKSVKEFVSL